MNNSVRFFPHWNTSDTSQVIGLIQMINYILSIKPESSHWLEIGSHNGESSTLFLGFDKIKVLECVEISHSSASILNVKYKEYIEKGRCIVHNKASSEFLQNIPDESFDVIYVDGEHDYDNVKKDIMMSFPKIKIGGFLSGHDYYPDELNSSWPGVTKALKEFSSINNYNIQDMKTFKDGSWVIQKL